MAGQQMIAAQITNGAAFMASLRRAVGALEIDTVEKLEALGLEAQNAARRYCPVDTGRLRSSIRSSGAKRDARGWVVTVGTNVEYAAYVEFGTRRMRAQPYLRPGVLAAARRGLS